MEIRLSQPYSFIQKGQRPYQEDARYPDMDAPDDFAQAFVVCDGVGGAECGDVASRTVADTIGAVMQQVDLERPFTVEAFEQVMMHAYDALDRAASAGGSPEMATTLTFICFHSGGVFSAHAGDSRIYHIRPGVGILRQSVDHSLVNALVRSGNITPEEAVNHPQSNVITRCIRPTAVDDPAPVDTLQTTDVMAGDYFFLCTDGVVHEVSDRELCDILSGAGSDKEKIRTIAGMSRYSTDNNTAYLIRVEEVTGGARRQVFREVPGVTSTTPLAKPNEEIIETFRHGVRNDLSVKERIVGFFKKFF